MKKRKPLIACIPNFSEGRRNKVIEHLRESLEAVAGIKLLDFSADKDHNRCVFTFIGSPAAIKEAVLVSYKTALADIDMAKHSGAHPRIGAVDVVPLVPIKDISMDETVALARELGKEIAEKYKLPVYLYEKAALKSERTRLEEIRKGNYEGLKQEIKNPDRKPDYGPAAMHPTAGATIIGARRSLIAFNVNLATPELNTAKAIARKVRARTGGLSGVKAIGVLLAEKQLTQVSMNLVDYTLTSIYTAFEMVKMEARRYGVQVVGSEIIGLLPLEAMLDAAAYYLQLDDFDAHQILETHLADL